MTVDVTAVPGVRPGDEVTLLGGGIGLDEVAGWAGTNRNDLLSRIGRRVPRVYLRGGEVEGIRMEVGRITAENRNRCTGGDTIGLVGISGAPCGKRT